MTEVRAFDQVEFNYKDLPDFHKKIRIDFFKYGINITGIVDGKDTSMIFITRKQLRIIFKMNLFYI